jgi:hypothetical protein
MIGKILWLPFKIILLPIRIVLSLVFGIVRIFVLLMIILGLFMFAFAYLGMDPSTLSVFI